MDSLATEATPVESLGAADRTPDFRSRRTPWRDPLRRRMLALADGLAVVMALLSIGVVFAEDLDVMLWAFLFLPIWIVLAKIHGLYDRDHTALRHLTVDELPTVLLWALTSTASMALILLVTPAASMEIAVITRVWLIASAGALLFRGAVRIIWRRLIPPDRIVIVGSGELADAVHRKLALFPDIHGTVVADIGEGEIDVLAGGNYLDADRIVLASQAIDEELIGTLLSVCRSGKIKLSVVPPARGMFGTAVRLNHVADLPIVEYSTWDVSRSTMLLKRVTDVFVSSLALCLATPIVVVLAIAIKLESRGPVFFPQKRAGKNGHPFTICKLRTMVVDACDQVPELVDIDGLPDPVFKLKDDPRVTRVGRFLRRFSLDELPQFVNVLKGDMSLVGPRPEELDLVRRYRPEHRFRLAVKPGVTGPMQVFGRGELAFDERLAVEREYIENLSLSRDFRILLMTVPVAILGKGAY